MGRFGISESNITGRKKNPTEYTPMFIQLCLVFVLYFYFCCFFNFNYLLFYIYCFLLYNIVLVNKMKISLLIRMSKPEKEVTVAPATRVGWLLG